MPYQDHYKAMYVAARVRIEKLEAHIREARSQLAWCNSQYGPDASTNTVLVALDRALNSIGGRRCLTGGPYEHEAV